MIQTFIPGKDAALKDSSASFLAQLGFMIEKATWLNPVPHVWSVHIRTHDCPLCFTNGKGVTRKAALASALGKYFERFSTNYFCRLFILTPRSQAAKRRICALSQRALIRASGRRRTTEWHP